MSETTDTKTLYSCPNCGGAIAADGSCYNLGACERADRDATRNAQRSTLKALAIALGGRVD